MAKAFSFLFNNLIRSLDYSRLFQPCPVLHGDAVGAFRVLYVAKFDDAVYVLHCFQKKTQKTSKADLNLAAQRYRDLLKELGQ
jgi:hypothetical protein